MCKFVFFVSILLVSSNISYCQVNYQELGQVFPDDVEIVFHIGRLETAEQVKDTVLRKLMLGFRHTDLKALEHHLSPALQLEMSMIDSVLDIHELKFDGIDSVFLFENSGYAVGQNGKIAITKFSHKVLSDLIIEYQYYCSGGDKIVNQIMINGDVYPSALNEVREYRLQIREDSLSPFDKFQAFSKLIELVSPREGEKMNDLYLPQSADELSWFYGSLSWYAINVGENETAVQSAKRGLGLNPYNTWITTNLVLGLAQLGRFEEAKEIYLYLKDIPYEDKLYKDVFIEDIAKVEANGIEVIYKKEILQLLQ